MANTGPLCYQQHWKIQDRESSLPELRLSAFNSFVFKGLKRGILAEVNGRRSSGRSSFVHHVLAQATRLGEICAVVDLNDSFAPHSAVRAGVEIDRTVWVRCGGNPDHAMRTVDLLLHAGGFGVVLLDLCDANPRMLNRIPLSYWYRFRRAVEHTPTVLLISAEYPQAKSCSVHTFALQQPKFCWSGEAPSRTLRGIDTKALVKVSGAPPQAALIHTVA